MPEARPEYEGSDIRDVQEFDMDNYRKVSNEEADTITRDQLFRRGFSYRQVEKFLAEREMRMAAKILEKDAKAALDRVMMAPGTPLVAVNQPEESGLPDGLYRVHPLIPKADAIDDQSCATCGHRRARHHMHLPEGRQRCGEWDCPCEGFTVEQQTLTNSEGEPVKPVDISNGDFLTIADAPPKPYGYNNGDWWQEKDLFFWDGKFYPRAMFPIPLDIPVDNEPTEGEKTQEITGQPIVNLEAPDEGDQMTKEQFEQMHAADIYRQTKNVLSNAVPNDPVNHPSHYKTGGYEVIDILEAFFPDDPLLWQVGKYIMRAGKKDPAKETEDLEKAAFYLKRRIENGKKGESTT